MIRDAGGKGSDSVVSTGVVFAMLSPKRMRFPIDVVLVSAFAFTGLTAIP
jgi:hypothetical protein